jgi:hypothetical protein
LGDFLLADYSGVSFTWQGVSGDAGLSPANPTYTKNLFLLASVNGADLTPWKSDAAVKELVVNTDYFVTNPSGDLYAGAANVPAVKGTTAVDITMRLEKSLCLELTGEVWFSFYMHATDGAYTISNFKFIPYDPDFEEVFPPPPTVEPPPVIEEFPEGAVTFDLDLEDNDYVSGVSGADPVEEIDFADGVLTVTFTKNTERLIIGLTPEQIAMLNTQKNGDKIYVLIEGEVTDGTGDLFRYHIGDSTAGSAWNGTNGSNDVLVPNGYKTLAEITLLELSFNNNRKFSHFILQHSGTDSVTIEITKITIGVMPPALNTWFFVDLSDENWEDATATNTSGIDTSLPTGSFDDDVLTITFSVNTQRANFKLSPAQRAALAASFANSAPGLGNTVKVTIVGEVADGTGDSFRYHIGDIINGGGWNATDGAGGQGAAFSTILNGTLTYQANFGAAHGGDGLAEEVTNDPNYFILQTRNANSITLEIESIKIEFVGTGGEITGDGPPPPPEPPAFFTTAVGIKDASVVGIYGSGEHDYDITTGILTVTGNGGFWVALPDGFGETDTVSIEYACYLTKFDSAKFVKKQDSGWTDAGDPNKYPSLSTASVSTITVTGFNTAGVTAGKAFFQTNNDEGEFIAKIKIISVAKE